jgi:hypothetical protein
MNHHSESQTDARPATRARSEGVPIAMAHDTPLHIALAEVCLERRRGT